ncbi:MAG: hypothetical protein Q9M26_00675 [Mariprofundales bacterium]|nr:hypothetical protein [Mariprofundales bacterium]
MDYKWITLCCLLTITSGCALTSGMQPRAKPSAFNFLNNYKSALHDFELGHVMEARAKIVAMDKSREDYAAAQTLLHQHIDPSRLKMLQFYLDRARLREKHNKWKMAAQDFGQAAYFSIRPKRWQQQRTRVIMKMRQLRFDILRKALQAEDRDLLAHPKALTPPKQLRNDPRIKAWQEARWNAVEEQSQSAYSKANGYLHDNLPELAYAELQSALRLDPGANQAQGLLDKVAKQLPPQIHLTRIKSSSRIRKPKAKHALPNLNGATIKQMIAAQQWVKARQYALAWKRQQGANAGKLLQQLSHQAQLFFNHGRMAVKQEKLDKAITLWQQAVTLAPKNKEYSKALEWAKQMQERLTLLKKEE